MKRIEAKAFTVGLSFDGAPALLCARVFINNGEVVGIRSLKLCGIERDPEGEIIPKHIPSRFVNGTEEFE